MSYNSKYKSSEIEAILDSVEGKQDEITDLATIRSGAAKGATALQSEQYKGTVTSVKINGSEKSPNADGVVDLGTIEGGGGGSSEKEVIWGDGLESITNLQPNKIYYIYNENGSNGSTLSIESFEPRPADREYYDVFTIVGNMGMDQDGGSTDTDEPITLILPDNILFASNDIPVVKRGQWFELSISRISDYGMENYFAVLTPFKEVE